MTSTQIPSATPKAAAGKTATRPARKTRPATPVKKATAVKKAVAQKASPMAKPDKVKKPKLVRDSFTIPKDEYTVLAQLKARSTQLAHPAKKSELLRAGIKALAALSDKALLGALQAVPSIKTGRPKKA